MKSKSKNLLSVCILSTLTLAAPNASAAIIAEFNFTADGDTQGWAAAGGTGILGLTTAGGFLTGTPTANDPQLVNNPVTFTLTGTQTWDTVSFRVRETDSITGLFIGSAGAPAFDPTGLIVAVNTLTVSSGFSVVASGDDFFTVTADISGLAATTITNIRVDPTGGALSNSGSETNGNFFEVDFIQVNAVPEPSTALLSCLGMLALLRRRR